MSPKKKSRSRKIRRALSDTVDKLAKRLAGKKSDPETEQSAETQKKSESRAVRYQPHRAKGIAFRDTRGETYGVTKQGELRALTKPRSRVKRLREERARKNEANQGKGPST